MSIEIVVVAMDLEDCRHQHPSQQTQHAETKPHGDILNCNVHVQFQYSLGWVPVS